MHQFFGMWSTKHKVNTRSLLYIEKCYSKYTKYFFTLACKCGNTLACQCKEVLNIVCSIAKAAFALLLDNNNIFVTFSMSNYQWNMKIRRLLYPECVYLFCLISVLADPGCRGISERCKKEIMKMMICSLFQSYKQL